jgi:hypothetical protein
MSKKPIKQPSKFWTGTKEVLKTLISNDACVDMKEKPWWSAIIVALLSVAIAVSPYSYYGWKTKGGDVLNGTTYGVKEGLISFDEDIAKKSALSMDVSAANKTLTVTGWETAYPQGYFDYTATFEKEVVTTTTDSSSNSTTTYSKTTVTERRFVVYYFASEGDQFKTDYTGILNAADLNGNATYAVSTLFLGTKSFYLVKNPTGATKATAALYGYYDGFTKDFSLKDFVKQNANGVAYGVTADQKNADNNDAYVKSSVATWSDVFTRGYASTVKTNGWIASGIAWAIDVSLIFLMGLMLFLMTRGKSNPYRIYTFWQCQKMGYWAALAPALLALIIGFSWNNSYALFFFLFLYGLRIMWMSMHSLSPSYQEQK